MSGLTGRIDVAAGHAGHGGGSSERNADDLTAINAIRANRRPESTCAT
jgi:hypothetical protein